MTDTSPVIQPDEPTVGMGHQKLAANPVSYPRESYGGNEGRDNFIKTRMSQAGSARINKRGARYISGRFAGKTPAKVNELITSEWDSMSPEQKDKWRTVTKEDKARARAEAFQAAQDQIEIAKAAESKPATPKAPEPAPKPDNLPPGDGTITPPGGASPAQPAPKKSDGGVIANNNPVSNPSKTEKPAPLATPVPEPEVRPAKLIPEHNLTLDEANLLTETAKKKSPVAFATPRLRVPNF